MGCCLGTVAAKGIINSYFFEDGNDASVIINTKPYKKIKKKLPELRCEGWNTERLFLE